MMVPNINIVSFDIRAMRAMYKNMHLLSDFSKKRLEQDGHTLGVNYLRKQREGLEKAIKEKFGVKVEKNTEKTKNRVAEYEIPYVKTPFFNKEYRESVEKPNIIKKLKKENPGIDNTSLRKRIADELKKKRSALKEEQNTVFYNRKNTFKKFKPKTKEEADILEEQVLYHELTEALRANTVKPNRYIQSNKGHWDAGVYAGEDRTLKSSGLKEHESPLMRFRKDNDETKFLKKHINYNKPLTKREYKKAIKNINKVKDYIDEISKYGVEK